MWPEKLVKRNDFFRHDDGRHEVKRVFDFDTMQFEYNSGFPTTPIGITQLALPAQGTAGNQRIGDEIMWRRFHIKGPILPYPFEPEVGGLHSRNNWVRFVLIYDTAPNGSLPYKNSILEDNPYALTEAVAEGEISYDNQNRYIKLWDWSKTLGGTNATIEIAGNMFTEDQGNLEAGTEIDFEVSINLPAVFKGTGGTLADVSHGALYLIHTGYRSGLLSHEFDGYYALEYTES